jgi:hypothetical protein
MPGQLRATIRKQLPRGTKLAYHALQQIDHVLGPKPVAHSDGRAFAAKHADNSEGMKLLVSWSWTKLGLQASLGRWSPQPRDPGVIPPSRLGTRAVGRAFVSAGCFGASRSAGSARPAQAEAVTAASTMHSPSLQCGTLPRARSDAAIWGRLRRQGGASSGSKGAAQRLINQIYRMAGPCRSAKRMYPSNARNP